MPKFLCLQRALPGAERPKPSPAQMQAMYEEFAAWMKRFEANLADPGGRLGRGTLVREGLASDGPLAEVKELVGGYMVVSADSLDEAVRVARACPGLVGPGSAVEVIEIRGP